MSRAGDPAAGEEVSAVGDGWVEVLSVNEAHKLRFREMGGQKTGMMGGHWRFAFVGDTELWLLLDRLVDLGLALRAGDEQSPAGRYRQLDPG
jgi:hypothetical protein